MTRLASLRFDRVLDDRERSDIARVLDSSGTTIRTWKRAGDRTFATLAVGPTSSLAELEGAVPLAVVAMPPEFALRVRPRAPHRLPRLLDAFGGAGAPVGVREACRDGDAFVIACDPERTSVALVLALIDAELAGTPGRAIEALVDLSDASLATLAGAVLGEPRLDASRILDTYADAVAGAI